MFGSQCVCLMSLIELELPWQKILEVQLENSPPSSIAACRSLTILAVTVFAGKKAWHGICCPAQKKMRLVMLEHLLLKPCLLLEGKPWLSRKICHLQKCCWLLNSLTTIVCLNHFCNSCSSRFDTYAASRFPFTRRCFADENWRVCTSFCKTHHACFMIHLCDPAQAFSTRVDIFHRFKWFRHDILPFLWCQRQIFYYQQ